MTDLLYNYLQNSNITSVSKDDIHLQLRSHEDYPSLNAITDTLDYFGIANVAAHVPKDALTQLPISFLGLVNQKNGQELIQIHQLRNDIKIKYHQGNTKVLSVAAFKEIWTGTIIAVEEEKNSQEKKIVKFGISSGLLLASVLLFIVHFVLGAFDLYKVVYTILSLAGILFSVLILKEELGHFSVLSRKVCGVLSTEKIGCSSVIKSNYGKIGKELGLGDLSLLYFISSCFSSAFLSESMGVFYALAILSLPVIAYSLYVQAFRLKKWCALCLGVAVVLIGQFGVLFFERSMMKFVFHEGIYFLFCATLFAAAWFFVKPLLKKERELFQVQVNFLKFKKDKEVFRSLLKKNQVTSLQVLGEEEQMRFGNVKAPIQLTAYTNPLCGFCTEAFQAYDRLMNQYPTDVNIQFIFNTPKDITNPSTRIAKRLFELYANDRARAFSALKDWFGTRDIDGWEERFGRSNTKVSKYDGILQQHRTLARINDITYTPETLVGNYKFPRSQYDYRDLDFFGDTLKEMGAEEEVAADI